MNSPSTLILLHDISRAYIHTNVQKSRVNENFLILLFSKNALNVTTIDSKYYYIVTNYYINKK